MKDWPYEFTQVRLPVPAKPESSWLETNLPHAEHVAVASNAEAARQASGTTGAAAIASETAAELYGLTIRNRNIEDEPDNTTRFLVIGTQAALPSGNDLTSLLISVRNKPGILYQMLQHIAKHGVSMTRIESRPSRQGLWEYLFYIDVEGHKKEPAVAAALAAGSPVAETSYSASPGTPGRLVVYLSTWDGDNADADDDPFTGTDVGLLWIRVEVEGSVHDLHTLRARGF